MDCEGDDDGEGEGEAEGEAEGGVSRMARVRAWTSESRGRDSRCD
jgi:hypothetical protein